MTPDDHNYRKMFERMYFWSGAKARKSIYSALTLKNRKLQRTNLGSYTSKPERLLDGYAQSKGPKCFAILQTTDKHGSVYNKVNMLVNK